MVSKTVKIILGILLIVVISASVAVSAFMGAAKNTSLFGMAYVDSPVVGATIRVFTISGTKILEISNATSSDGFYSLNVPWLWMWSVPTEFKITATDGTLNGDQFNGTITRYVEDYDQANAYTINPISTIVAAYKEKNPSLSYTTVQQNVSSYLEIPSFVSLDSVVSDAFISNTFFDDHAFAIQAQANGDFNGFVDQLAIQVGEGQTHPFQLVGLNSAPGEEQEGLGSALFSWGAEKIADGLAEKGVDIGLGWVMEKIGFESDTDKIMEQLEIINQKLDQIINQLNVIQQDLNRLSSQVAALQSALVKTQNELQKSILSSGSYDPLAKIDTTYSTIVGFSSIKPGSVPTKLLDDTSQSITNPTTGITYAMNLLNKFLVGHQVSNEEGLMEIMVDSMCISVYSGASDAAYRSNVLSVYQGFTDWFQKMLFEELKGLDVIVDAYHEQNATALAQAYFQDTWKPMLNNQVNLYKTLVERFVITAESSGCFLEFPNMGPVPSSMQSTFANAWHTMYSADVPASVSTMAEILPNAYQYADTLLNGTGKFTAAVLYSGKPNANPADPMPVFQNIATGKTYQISGTLKSVDLSIIQKSQVIYYRTYDFGQLPAGIYKLVSPLKFSNNPVSTGWDNKETYQNWKLSDGSMFSTKLAPLTPSTPGSIYVINDANGHPYGYWGGMWWLSLSGT